MTLFWISISSLLAGFGLGYVKFFLLSLLGTEMLLDKSWMIQEVGAIITLGPFLIFWAAAPLASSFKKRYIMASAGLVTFGLLSFGAISDWAGSAWWYLFASGLVMGFFNPAKNAAIPLEAKHGNHTTESVNATINIAFLLGLLSGIPAATFLYNTNYLAGEIVLLLSFFGCGVAGLLCSFKGEEQHLIPYKQARSNFIADTKRIYSEYSSPLLISGLVWGLANAISLAITAYAETNRLGNSFQCSLMSVYAILGVSLGNVIAVYLANYRRVAVILGFMLLMLSTGLIPPFCQTSIFFFGAKITYWLLALLVVILGVGFGLSSNLVEAEYFRVVYDDKMEGTGGALLSAATALFSSVLGIVVGAALQLHILGPQTQFICLAVLVVIPLMIFLKSDDSVGWWHSFAAATIRKILSLRYKIDFINEKCIPENGPVLILPNHPAEVDPIIICSRVWKTRPVVPLMLETFYNLPVVSSIMKSIDAIPIPDLEFDAGPYKQSRVAKALDQIVDHLKDDRAVLMYPSGRLQRGGNEIIGSASGLKKVLEKYEQVPIVLVRTKGLYGSIFSCAFSGLVTPDFFTTVKQAVLIIIKNLIFFIPKRNISVEFTLAPADFPRYSETKIINRWLENWYNQPGFSECKLVPEQFWNLTTRTPSSTVIRSDFDVTNLDLSNQEVVNSYLALLSGKEQINLKDSLRDDLSLDSLQLTELISWLEEEFNVYDISITDLSDVRSVLLVSSKGSNKNGAEIVNENESVKSGFGGIKSEPIIPKEQDIYQAFLKIAKSRSDEPALSDSRAGVLSWRKVLRASYLLRRCLIKLDDKKIGVLLPAAASTSITIVSLMAARKIPVMINWTTGRVTVKQILKESGVNKILTSRTFLDQVQSDLTDLEPYFLFLEDLLTKEGFLGLVRSWLDLYLPPSDLPSYQPDDTAIILFTSGSESIPKGVPLTHSNILSNIRDSLEIIPLSKSDVLVGFLPPFHSFGLTITTILPLVTGVRVAYHPNPSEASKIARIIKRFGVTVMSGTPTFIRQILNSSNFVQLSSLRLLLIGAEKTPESLVKLIDNKSPSATPLEGYGITECSPIVSVNRLNSPSVGVGKPLPSVNLKIVKEDHKTTCNVYEEGMILVSGPSVFNGYLNSTNDPFIGLEGKRWYITGDLGYLDQEGNLTISGRLSRFVKIAGEMISLQALEDALLKLTPPSANEHDEDLQLAVVAYEPANGERPKLALYSTHHIDLDVANLFLKEQGFANLAKLSHSFIKQELPLLGSGKCDVRVLIEEFKNFLEE